LPKEEKRAKREITKGDSLFGWLRSNWPEDTKPTSDQS